MVFKNPNLCFKGFQRILKILTIGTMFFKDFLKVGTFVPNNVSSTMVRPRLDSYQQSAGVRIRQPFIGGQVSRLYIQFGFRMHGAIIPYMVSLNCCSFSLFYSQNNAVHANIVQKYLVSLIILVLYIDIKSSTVYKYNCCTFCFRL